MVSKYPFKKNGELYPFFVESHNENKSVIWKEGNPFKDTMRVLNLNTVLGNNPIVVSLMSEKNGIIYNVSLPDFLKMSQVGVFRDGCIHGIFNYTRFSSNCYGIALQELLDDPKQKEVDALIKERDGWLELLIVMSKNLKRGYSTDPNYKKLLRIIQKVEKEREASRIAEEIDRAGLTTEDEEEEDE